MTQANPVARALLPAARALSLIAGYLLLGLALLVTAEILLRRFMNFSLQGGDEFGGYVLAILAAFGFSYALLERSHTRVEILLERVGTGARSILNLISAWCVTVMACFMAWRAYAALSESIEYRALSGTPLMTPLWQPQILWFAGLLFFAVTSAAVALHASWLMARDRSGLNRFYGVKTLDEIIEEETVPTLEMKVQGR
ncbi:MAG: TRAP transporter small permease [Bosea sp.]|uniref:TRAP transporter small permease subunit n=1 Tax=Bosea sp. (in: a-proteobacteria) TaxID=1871050 RepID=UPI001AC2C660|nr:TRAP transporter small permease [Bosea sp. (in: a-proteobacteria)]MBN9470923.1 TRAP transporter small permease [Bosea sp. (in: a-proteobacteria)]